MDTINDFFGNLGAKMPFASDFFARNLQVGSGQINTLFVAMLAAVVVLIAIVVCIACACHTAKKKRQIARARSESDNLQKAASAPFVPYAEEEEDEDDDDIDIQSGVNAMQPQEESQVATQDEQPADDVAHNEMQEEDAQTAAQVEQPTPEAQNNAPETAVGEIAREQAEEQVEEAPQTEESAPDALNEAADNAEAEAQADESAPATEEETQPATDDAQGEQPDGEQAAEATATEQGEETAQEEGATAEPEQEEDTPAQAQPEQEESVAAPTDAQESQSATQSPSATQFALLMATAQTAADAPCKPMVPVEKTSGEAVAMEDTAMKKEESKKVSAKVETAQEQDKKANKGLIGTFEVSLCLDGYRFCLYASNKQLMYESVGFTSIEGAMKGIETFRKTLQETKYIITSDKYGRFRYVFNKRYQGENYTSASSAQSAAESVKRWAENAKVIVRNPKPEELEAYKKGLDGLRTKDDVDWDAVARAEAAERKMGKFTVEEDGNGDEIIGYRFYLIANNAQILYTSAIYTSASGALKAIDTFKRAVYVGNFYVDEDKFGHFRYILRSNATTTYVGESYTTRARAESSIESVKKFVKCAAIVPFKKGADED